MNKDDVLNLVRTGWNNMVIMDKKIFTVLFTIIAILLIYGKFKQSIDKRKDKDNGNEES